ncbi:hypothetical protein L2E82_30089 [Cichorium intybus]|uniref:Uncharacterized protein n=1 Tax=Cichorium intybus TaxID=13427 RepID=A0ACB9CZR1_CICIN|nr:hypothetical protein L2E82_30089 [Cichorium intybus]
MRKQSKVVANNGDSEGEDVPGLIINEDIIAKGGSFLEAPVSRRIKPVEDGQLVILSASEKICYLVAISSFNATLVILEIQ